MPDRSPIPPDLAHIIADLARLRDGRLVLTPEEAEWMAALEARVAEIEREMSEECREEP